MGKSFNKAEYKFDRQEHMIEEYINGRVELVRINQQDARRIRDLLFELKWAQKHITIQMILRNMFYYYKLSRLPQVVADPELDKWNRPVAWHATR